MRYEFDFAEIEEIMDKLAEYYSEEDCEYQDAISEDGVDYCVREVCIHLPELNIAVREGIAYDSEDEDEFDCVMVYDEDAVQYSDVTEINSNIYLESLISMVAYNKGFSKEAIASIKCYINTGDNDTLEKYLVDDK